MDYHCINAYPIVVSTGSYQELVTISPWLTEDVYITGWNLILIPYPSSGPRVSASWLMGQMNENGVPKFNFANFGGNGGDFSVLEPEYDFQMPPGYGFLLPGTGHATRTVTLQGILPTGQSFQPFLTMRYQLASEGAFVEPKTKTLVNSATTQVPFLILQTPWESFATNIIGVELALTVGTAMSMHVCNSASPDIVKNVGYHKRYLNYWTPPGVTIPFPASGGDYPPHIDCHVELDPHASSPNHTAYMVVYYVPQ